ncbi:hypothetical protein E2C01_004858 [Portunus trituberculatus]|uniref:Uncharacterized protein n=1 Tax=Portunus trituberculatus TaxID=210409 RepID=A0A5B7CRT3_PORTR|nr:hypothetical protein [Portunus trituberculatus]
MKFVLNPKIRTPVAELRLRGRDTVLTTQSHPLTPIHPQPLHPSIHRLTHAGTYLHALFQPSIHPVKSHSLIHSPIHPLISYLHTPTLTNPNSDPPSTYSYISTKEYTEFIESLISIHLWPH